MHTFDSATHHQRSARRIARRRARCRQVYSLASFLGDTDRRKSRKGAWNLPTPPLWLALA